MAAGEAETSNQSARSTAIKRLGGFELVSKVGQGGMGSVFKARQISLDRIVAVKVLPPSIAQNDPVFIENFIREARTSAKLNHPNVVQGIEVGQDEATKLYFFAMEFVDGPSLKILLKHEKVIAEKRALEIIWAVAQAVLCAQRAGIVHRDIKPDNILLTTKGEVKLADLGLALGNAESDADDSGESKRSKSQSSAGNDGVKKGNVIGTPMYMAPEQIRGETERFDVRTDLYALGATFFHIVTGRPPYPGDKSATIMNLHLTAPVPNPRELNPEVSVPTASIIMKLLQKDPAKRYQSAGDLAAALNAVMRGERVPGDKTTARRTPVKAMAPVPEVTPTPKAPTSRLVPAIASALLVVAVVGILIFKSSQGGTAVGMKEKLPSQAPVAPIESPEKKSADNQETQVKVAVPEAAENKKDPVVPVSPAKTEVTKVDGPKDLANPEKSTIPIGVPATPKDQPIAVVPPSAQPQPPTPGPAPTEKKEPPLEEVVLAQIKDPLDKLDLVASHAKLKEFAAEKKLEPAKAAAAELVLDGAIEARAKALEATVQDLLAQSKLDEAQQKLDGAKFAEGNTSAGETAAKALVARLRDTLATDKALQAMRAGMRQLSEVDTVLLGVSAALDAGHYDQAAKWLEEAIAQPNFAPSVDFFKNERRLVDWHVELQKAIEAGAALLADNRPFALTLADGRTVRIGKMTDLKLINVAEGVMNLEQRLDRGVAKRPVKLDTLSRETRYDLSLLVNPDDKASVANLRLKWAYADLSTMTAITSKSSAVLERAEKLIADAASLGAAPADVAAIQPWLSRAQTRVRLPQRSSKGGKNLLLPFLPFVNVVSVGGVPGRCKIAINGRPLLEATGDHRGLNVVAIVNDRVALRDTYDTSVEPAASKRFADAIGALPKGALVLVTVCDDASKNFEDTAYATLRSLGARVALQGKPFHFSYYCIGMTGLDEGFALEEMSAGPLEYPKPGAAAAPKK